MKLKFVVYADAVTGRLTRVSSPQYKIDSEGLSEDGTLRIIHVHEDKLPEGCENMKYFMDFHWYDAEERKFLFTGLPPNRHAVWNIESLIWEWDHERLLKDVRTERNRRLILCDWTQGLDVPLSESQLQEWRDYRQSLRNLPDEVGQISSVQEVIWPTPPS
jgi:hypothetical protein